MGCGRFWLCLLAILVVGLIPRFLVKVCSQYLNPDDIHVARAEEKFAAVRENVTAEVQMNPLPDPRAQ